MKQIHTGLGLAGLAVLLVALFVASRQAPGEDHQVAVAAASDLRYALEPMVDEFQRAQPEIHVSVSYGSSGNFYAQLSRGAPFDVFLSADMRYPRELIAAGLAERASEFLYAEGQLVLWVPASSKLDVDRLGWELLREPSVLRIAIANPEHAPYGRAAVAAMRSADVFATAESRLVLGENVSQAMQFVQSGAADAGVVAMSLAVAPVAQGAGRFWVVPADSYPPLEQGGIIMRSAEDLEAANAFRNFLTSDRGRTMLARYGFLVASGPVRTDSGR